MATKNGFLLLVVVLLGIVLRVALFSGYQDGDDSAYIAKAFAYSEGDWLPPYSHWGSRMFPVLLTTLSYSIFGVSEFSTVLFPFLFSVGGIVVGYLIGRHLFDVNVGLVAAFFIAIFPMEVLFASQLFPYSLLSFLCSLSLYLFLKGVKEDQAQLLFIAGIILGLAYLSRITALYSLLFFGLYLVWQRNVFQKKWLLMALGLLAVFMLEALLGYLQSGDILQRLHVLMDRNAANVVVMNAPNSASAFSPDLHWFVEPIIRPITEQETGLYFLVLWFVVTYQLIYGRHRGVIILLLWVMPILLYISYGTTSPTDYKALRRLPRYLSIIIIPSMVLISYQLVTLSSKKKAFSIALLLVMFSVLALVVDNSRHVVEKERALATYIDDNPQYKYILPRPFYYDILFFNKFVVRENVTLYANNNDRSDGLKRINIVAPGLKTVNSLSDTCGYLIAKEGGYIKEISTENERFVKFKVFPQTKRLYDLLKESQVVMKILSLVRDKRRMTTLKRSMVNEIALYRHECK